MFSIRLINTQIVVDTKEFICSLAEITQAEEIVQQQLPALFASLPEGHMWRDKPDHMQHSKGLEIVRDSVLIHCPMDWHLLKFIYSVHDIGRVTEANLKPGQSFIGHAAESVRLLQEWGVDKCFSLQTWDIISTAIANHTQQYIPMVAEDASDLDKLKYVFTVLLRDVDKFATYRDKTTAYLVDPEKKRKEMEQNNFAECYRVNQLVMQSFLDRVVPQRSEIATYEAYMLYYLAWIFDINTPKVLEAIVEDGCLKDILRYLQDHLKGDQFQDQDTFELIFSTVKKYLEPFNLSVQI